jgi:hypothetical protein
VRETVAKDNLMDGKNELFDLNREKQELDLFLSSITGGKVPPVAAKGSPAETFMPGVLPSDSKSKPKITDDKISTGKWEKTPFAMDKTSTRQSYDVNSNEEISQFAPEDVGSHKITWIALIIVFLILFFMAVGFLWFYPEKKNQTLQWMVSNIPYADKVLTVDNEQKNPDTGKIKFIDVRQRFIRNISLGRNIRVIEGIVKNNTAANISKVKLLGELYDSERLLLLTSKPSLAGNVLTDDKLENLDEDEIFSALSIAPASNLSEAKIPPMGQVPFMIVFIREPAKVFKLVVIPVSE